MQLTFVRFRYDVSRYFLGFMVVAVLFIPHASAQVVEIPDPNLERAIREELGLSSEVPITQQEMSKLFRLRAARMQIESLTGLEYAHNLESLVIRDNPISDLTPIASLKRLQSLNLAGIPIENLTFLKDLTQLRDLHLYACEITDITPLENLTKLVVLILEANRITDLSPLSNLTALETLRLGHNFIVDISPLANLTQLTDLNLYDNQIKDVAPLANLTQLTDLALGRNYVVDISPLANLIQLKDLSLVDNLIVDVSPLANLTQLTDLALANNAITDFRPLFGLNLQSIDIDIHKLQELASSEIEIPDPNLERAIRETLGLPSHLPITQQVMLLLYRLSAADAQIENLTGLEYAHNLEDLTIRDNPISDLTPIAGLNRLEYLNLSGIPIEDLTFLKDLTQLRGLHLYACKITDITPLANLTRLVVLTLEANRITDLSPLSNLTALETLRLQANYIVDISPLANLTQLKDLSLVDNLIENVGSLANLTRLEKLWINGNRILDFSPIQGLSLVDFRYDEVCLLPGLPIQERIENRSLPSIVAAFGDGLDDLWDSLPAVSHLSIDDRIAYHDLFWHGVSNPFELYFQKTPPWSQLSGPIEVAIDRRNKLLAKNPNMLFLAHVVSRYFKIGTQFPEDWSGWLRDADGNPLQVEGLQEGTSYIDITQPEAQDIMVEKAVSIAKCGIFDGIHYDTWWDETSISTNILKRIREKVPEDFLITINANRDKLPLSIPYINGGMMETFPRVRENGYTRADIIEIETNLIWYEANAREPQINVLRGFGIGAEPPDSPRNKQWMRLFTTMSLTLSDGYALYTIGTIGGQKQYQKHIWHPFWDADLGQPIGPTAQRYRDIEGLYIREFTNGWAVYNQSGSTQEISLPGSVIGVSNGQTNTTHLLPDLDGEMYLKAPNPADVNSDGQVNILDLVHVANNFGKASPDPNGDGVVNVLDLVFVAGMFGTTAAAPSAHLRALETLTAVEVRQWLTDARSLEVSDPIMKRGIIVLEQLLVSLTPKETELLSNYPNPFNPETWIPYRLAEDAFVTLTIYDRSGRLVRRFDVGHQIASAYENRSKAIYWDGKNELGERVASGMYFYHLSAGDYSATRRMLVIK